MEFLEYLEWGLTDSFSSGRPVAGAYKGFVVWPRFESLFDLFLLYDCRYLH